VPARHRPESAHLPEQPFGDGDLLARRIPPNRPLLRTRYCRFARDSKTEIGAPSGPSRSMIAGLRLLGEIARMLGSNGSLRPMDRAKVVRQAALLEHDRNLAAVRRRPLVEVDPWIRRGHHQLLD